jgi:hypothetical protein
VSDNYVKFELAAAMHESEEFAAALKQLEKVPHGVFVTTGALLPGIIEPDDEELPMLVLRSARVSENWLTNDSFGPVFAIDACAFQLGGSPYLTWSGCELSVAVTTMDIPDALYAGQEYGKVLVVWVTDDALFLDSFKVDEDFSDYWYGISKARDAWSFVPDDGYIESLHAEFPSLLTDDEERFIGSKGEPTYVAMLCE